MPRTPNQSHADGYAAFMDDTLLANGKDWRRLFVEVMEQRKGSPLPDEAAMSLCIFAEGGVAHLIEMRVEYGRITDLTSFDLDGADADNRWADGVLAEATGEGFIIDKQA